MQYSGYWYMIRTLHTRSHCRNARLDHFYPTECILSDLICVSPQCPIDARKVLSENLVVIGGTAMLPGFLHRLLAEIRLLVERPKYSSVLASKTLRIHAPPAKPNCTAWLGGQRWDFEYLTLPAELKKKSFKRILSHEFKSPLCNPVLCSTGAIFGALQDILGSRSVSRDYYNQTGRIPDWCCLSSPPPESLYEAGKTPPPLMKRAFSTEK